MKVRSKGALVFLVLLFVKGLLGVVFARTLWVDFHLFRPRIEKGDIIKVRFSEKTLLKYEIEQRRDQYESSTGRKGQGELFSFFPDVEIADKGNRKNQNRMNVKRENRFALPALVMDVDEDLVYIKGSSSTYINGDLFLLEFGGICDRLAIRPDRSIYSTDVYDLNFNIRSESATNASILKPEDLVFATNYSRIITNTLVTNGQTNRSVSTNFSAVKFEFKGIADSKKKELIMHYMNVMVNALFR